MLRGATGSDPSARGTVPTMGRRVVAGFGRLLLAAGVLVLLFVAYQLWGTGLSESHAQSTLGQEYRALTHSPPATAPAVVPGGALGIIQIPRIGLEKYLVQGTAEADLQKGPGHYVDTPLPGQPGNVGIAGHRTTYGAPFYNLDQLRAPSIDQSAVQEQPPIFLRHDTVLYCILFDSL